MKIAFVCVHNAGRSQMAAAFAERAVVDRGVEDEIEILTGGTMPGEHVHDVVVEAMTELGYDLSDRVPREITQEGLEDVEYVITMGCSAEDICPATWQGDERDWGLDDPKGKEIETVRAIRDEIATRVDTLLDEVLATASEK